MTVLTAVYIALVGVATVAALHTTDRWIVGVAAGLSVVLSVVMDVNPNHGMATILVIIVAYRGKEYLESWQGADDVEM